MPSNSNFTTSGLKGHDGTIQRKTQPVTRNTFPRITKFEKEYLTSKPIFLGLSLLAQKSLQQEVQDSFFAWMMEKRKDGKTTTPLVKEMKYKSISEKHIAAIEDGPGLFGFLTGLNAPAFQNVDDLCENFGGGEDLSPVFGFQHTGVILSCQMPFSRPLGPCEVSTLCQSELDVMPFLELFDSPVYNSGLPSFPAVSATFPPPPHSDEEVPVADSGTEIMWEREKFLQRFDNPDVARTLREIEKIQGQISEFCNTPNLDASLGPSDWFQSE